MNFTTRATAKKQKQLVSIKNKLVKKTAVMFFKAVLFCALFVCVCVVSFGLGMLNGIIESAPDISTINISPNSYSSTVYDSDGNEIAKLVTSGSNRIKVSIDEVPEHLQWAFIDIEDERFYEHNGIDIQGILRAAGVALTTGSLSEGASTITQQVLKNNVFTEWTEENNIGTKIKRKIQEQYLALKLEETTTKETILENYLNTINLGSNTLGVQAASQRYFNKDVSELTISESAVIAAITQNPTAYNPISHPEANAERREKILGNMLDNGHITEEEYEEAMADDVYERIQTVDLEKSDTTVYSYFTDEVITQVMEDLQEELDYTYTQAYNAVYSGGLSIYTTLDSQIQAICDEETSDDSNYSGSTEWSFTWAWSVVHEDGETENYSESSISYYYKTLLGDSDFDLIFSSKDEIDELIADYKAYLYPEGLAETDTEYESLYYTPQPQISFTVIDQSTGYVKAVVGGRGEKEVSLSLNRATQSTRQPGSTFKILAVYAPAIDAAGYTLTSTEVDEPYTYSNGKKVSNWWGDSYRGTVTIRQAIAQSMNIIAVKVLTEITPELGFEYLQNFGFTTLVESRTESDGSVVTDITQSLALGGITDGVTNIEMCAAYATIANDGVYNEPVYYTQVIDDTGRVLLDKTESESHTVIEESTALQLTLAMLDVVESGTGTAAAISGIDVAGKTGTTSSNYDLWFAGFTPYLTAVIWTGYDENKDIGTESTTTYHKYLWATIMKRIHNEVLDVTEASFEEIDNLVTVKVCNTSGMLAHSGCTDTSTQYFTDGSEPTEYCTYHSWVKETTTAAAEEDDDEDESTEESDDDESSDEESAGDDSGSGSDEEAEAEAAEDSE